MTVERGPLADILPIQETYYVLRHPLHSEPARMGNIETQGLLVFSLLEEAEIYCFQVAQNGWKPQAIGLKPMVELAVKMGAVCRSDRGTITVARVPKDFGEVMGESRPEVH